MDPELTATARSMMVDSQVRPNKVYNPRLIAALRRIPREQFLPPAAAARAYADDNVALPAGRCLIAPMVIARLIQEAAPRDHERALVVAAGSGYGAALLSACGPQVTALEDDPALLSLARAALPVWAPAVTLAEGPPAAGHPAGAPYELILIEGALDEVPPALIAQLAPLGRLIAVRRIPAPAGAGSPAQAIIGEPVAGRLSIQPLFDCAVPLLPALRPAPSFVF